MSNFFGRGMPLLFTAPTGGTFLNVMLYLPEGTATPINIVPSQQRVVLRYLKVQNNIAPAGLSLLVDYTTMAAVLQGDITQHVAFNVLPGGGIFEDANFLAGLSTNYTCRDGTLEPQIQITRSDGSAFIAGDMVGYGFYA